MTNQERIQKRIERDKKRRKRQRIAKNPECYDFDSIFTYQRFYDSLAKCKKGVSWKASVQKYDINAIAEITNTVSQLYGGCIVPRIANDKIIISERGKQRCIVPIKIGDRMVQRTLCDGSLTEVVSNSLIYDNGASLQGKGVQFTRRRVLKHFRAAQREYGDNFYILVFDFKSFFDSIPHKLCYEILDKYYDDKEIVKCAMKIITSYQMHDASKIKDKSEKARMMKEIENYNSRGICLGSQISQVLALVVPNAIDHYIKDVCGFKHYIRYMDDGVVMSDDKEALQKLFGEMVKIADTLGLTFSLKKTHITKSTKGFTFLKIRYFISKDGKIVKCLVRTGITRMRRKLKKFRKKVDAGRMTYEDVYNSVQSWLAHSKEANSYRTVRTMLKLYDELFDGYRITKKYRNKQRKLDRRKGNALLQAA